MHYNYKTNLSAKQGPREPGSFGSRRIKLHKRKNSRSLSRSDYVDAVSCRYLGKIGGSRKSCSPFARLAPAFTTFRGTLRFLVRTSLGRRNNILSREFPSLSRPLTLLSSRIGPWIPWSIDSFRPFLPFPFVSLPRKCHRRASGFVGIFDEESSHEIQKRYKFE